MLKTSTTAGARTHSVRQEKNSNGSFRYVVKLSDGTEEVLRWRATGDYSHVLIYPDGSASFRSSAAPATRGATCFVITKPGDAPLVPHIATVSDEKEVAQVVAPVSSDDLPEYVAQNGEIDDLKMAIGAGENTLLTGPTGCGKTHAVLWAAHLLGRKIVTLQGGEGMTPEHMIGYRDVSSDGQASFTEFRYGLATTAAREGSILYCDEPNALPDGIRFYLFSLMDQRREVTLAENRGEVVKAADGFVVIGAMNEGAGYSGTSLLNHAFRARFGIIIDLNYLPMDREAEMLAKRSGADKGLCEKLAKVASDLRNSHACGGSIKTPVGTRALLACAKLIALGVAPLRAAGLTIAAQVPTSFTGERKAFLDVFAAYFQS